MRFCSLSRLDSGLLTLGPAAIPLINRLMGPCDGSMEERLAETLAKIGGLAIGPLIDHLENAAPEIRRKAAVALGETGDRRATMPLIERLKNEDYDVRRAAIVALGKIGDREAVKYLADCLTDPYPSIRGKRPRPRERSGIPGPLTRSSCAWRIKISMSSMRQTRL